jgi:p21-activated kinase 1
MVPEFYNRLATMDLNKKRKTMMPEKFASIFSEENPLTDHGNTESTHADSTPPVLSDKKGSDFLPSQAKGILKKKRERRKIQTDVSSDIDLSRGFLIMDDPGSRYHRFQEVDHAGHAILSLEDKEHLPHVLIKERRGNKSIPYSLKGASHENVVGLLAAFYHSGVVSLVYECHYVNMTVASVSGCSEFKETDIATVCREALQGLEYIHSELRVAHGSVNDKNIILTLSGDVKIGAETLNLGGVY